MVTFLFVFPPSRSDYTFRFHLGVGYIQAYLKDRGINAPQYVPKKRMPLPKMVDDILKHKPEVVGFTCYDSNYYIIKSIARLLKNSKPDLPVVIGGPTATFSDSFVLKDCPDIDICVRGEGEETTYELIKSGLTNLEKISGITFREKDLTVQVGDRPLIRGEKRDAELDILPSPYLKEVAPLDGKAGVLTSRGCVYNCTFCNFSAMSRHSIRYHSVYRVIEELRKIDEYINHNFPEPQKPLVQFNDDTFSLKTERAKEICRRIIQEKINLRFYADTRADFCDVELLKLMHEAGFREVNFGLETAAPRILRNIKKIYSGDRNDFTLEKQFLHTLKENVRLAKKLGFHTSVSIILGLPGETIEDAMKTLQFVKELKVNEYSHNFLKIYPGTKLFETYRDYDLDLKESATILPYQTIYPYNVYALNPLPHASLQKSVTEDETTYVELIANNLTQLENTDWLNLITSDIKHQDTFASWLVNIGTLPFSLYYHHMNYWPIKESASQFVNELVQNKVPIGNFYFLTKVPLEKQVNNAYKLMRFGQSIWPHSLFVEMPFSKYQNRNFLPENAKLIFTITNKDDVETLIYLSKTSINSEIINLQQPYPLSCIRDECRWVSEPCPAMKFHRLIIRPSFSIVTCFNGKPIGFVNSSYEEMETTLKNIQKKELSSRNCAKCPVRDACSKCLFPFPLTTEEYCDLKRTHPEIRDYLSLFRTTRLLLRDGGPLSEKKFKMVSTYLRHKKAKKFFKTRVKKDIELIYADGRPYVVNAKTQKIFGLNKQTAHVLSALMRGTGLKDLAESLHESYGEGKGKVVNYVKEALKSFEEKGFLELDDLQ